MLTTMLLQRWKAWGKRSHGSLHFLIMTQIQLLCNLILYRATGNCSNRVTALVIKTCSICNMKMLLLKLLAYRKRMIGQNNRKLLSSPNWLVSHVSPHHITCSMCDLCYFHGIQNVRQWTLHCRLALLGENQTNKRTWDSLNAVRVCGILHGDNHSLKSIFCRKEEVTSPVFESVDQPWGLPLIILLQRWMLECLQP